MHSARRHFTAIFFGFLSIASHLSLTHAQTEPEGKKQPPIQIRVLCSEPVKGASELQLVQGETMLKELSLLPSMVSDPIGVGRGEMVLARRSAEAKKLDAVLKFSIPESGQRFVLVLFPAENPKDNTPFQHVLVRTDGLRFGISDIYLFNFTQLPIAGSLGKTAFSLAPGKSEVVTPVPPAAGERMYQARFYYLQEPEKRLFADGRWPMAAGSRIYMFFIPDSARKTVTYLSFREYAPFE